LHIYKKRVLAGRYSYKRAIGQLTEYAVNEGYANISLNHKGVSMIKWNLRTLNEPKSIYIEGKYGVEIKTYLMLHELGHHEIRKNWKKFTKRFPASAYAEEVHLATNDKRYKRRDSYVVASLEEEFMAWEEGLKLGKRLGIKINMDKWIDFKSKCLKSYIVYFANLKK
jgi:hypothetical protein